MHTKIHSAGMLYERATRKLQPETFDFCQRTWFFSLTICGQDYPGILTFWYHLRSSTDSVAALAFSNPNSCIGNERELKQRRQADRK